MTSPTRLTTYDPNERSKRNQHERDGDVEFVLACWKCGRDFYVWIGLGNLGQCIFECAHCGTRNEIE